MQNSAEMNITAGQRPIFPPSFPILWRDSVGYEAARTERVFNHRRPHRYPAAIIQATEEAHIVQGVLLAKQLGCRVSVISGGHSWAAWGVRDGAVMIDLKRFYAFDLDTGTGVLKASPSTTGRLISRLLAPHGRWFPGGHCGEVGIGGFLLQGGIGWNTKNEGFAAQKVLAVDVVTAEGEQLHCNRNENADLFWAARGSGPGFPAVVTRFHLQTLPVHSHLRCSNYVYASQDYRKVMEWITRIAPTFDTSTEIVAVACHAPGTPVPVISISLLAFKDSEQDAEEALRPAEDTAPPDAIQSWFCRKTDLQEQFDIQVFMNPYYHRYHVDNCYIRNDVDVISAMEPAFTTLPTPRSFAMWYPMAPGNRKLEKSGALEEMSVSMYTDHYFAVYALCEKEEGDAEAAKWVRDVLKQMQPHSAGAYLGDADFQFRTTKYWSDHNGRRLREVRKKWDPTGRLAGYLDAGDKSGYQALENVNEWDL